jgi:hypothetical protein
VKHRIAASWWRLFVLSSRARVVERPARGTDPPYVERLPSVDQVLADHQGADPADTLARQEAALNQLAYAIGLLAGGSMTDDEQRKRGQYLAAARKGHGEAIAPLSKDKRRQPSSASAASCICASDTSTRFAAAASGM